MPPGMLQPKMEVAGYISLDVALPEGRNVIQVIDKIAAVVVQTVRRFEPLL